METTTTLGDGSTVTRETYEDGSWVEITRDSRGRKARFEDSYGYWHARQYDARGLEARFENSSGFWHVRQYDERCRDTRYENSDGRVVTYAYDDDGEQVEMVVSAGVWPYPPTRCVTT